MNRWATVALPLALACQANDLAQPDAGSPRSAWVADSQRIEVACHGYFVGLMKFSSERKGLTDQQLSLLGTLQVVPQASPGDVEQLICRITVTDAAGTEKTYVADENARPSCAQTSGCQLVPDSITFGSFFPFGETIPCRFQGLSGPNPFDRDPNAPDDDRCRQ
jgi:hypothetical protein